MSEDTLISVEWKGGKVRGFRSKKAAERFIVHVCRRIAPDLNYSVYSIYRSK